MIPVPVHTTDPAGTRFARSRYSVSVSNFRCSRAVEVEPSKRLLPFRLIVQVISRLYGSRNSSGVTITGPSAQQAVYTFDCGRYSAFSRSISHADTSLASVYPRIFPPLPRISANSGSGAVNLES